jgi:hypothetical protein
MRDKFFKNPIFSALTLDIPGQPKTGGRPSHGENSLGSANNIKPLGIFEFGRRPSIVHPVFWPVGIPRTIIEVSDPEPAGSSLARWRAEVPPGHPQKRNRGPRLRLAVHRKGAFDRLRSDAFTAQSAAATPTFTMHRLAGLPDAIVDESRMRLILSSFRARRQIRLLVSFHCAVVSRLPGT